MRMLLLVPDHVSVPRCLAGDGILKPMLFGRGVEIPMLVILIGAIGGMIAAGIIGLFIGAVILALTYKHFMAWLASDRAGEVPQTDGGT